jgi:hypothetical protein
MEQEIYSDDVNNIVQETSSQNITDVAELVLGDNIQRKKRSIVHLHFTFNDQQNAYHCKHCR